MQGGACVHKMMVTFVGEAGGVVVVRTTTVTKVSERLMVMSLTESS